MSLLSFFLIYGPFVYPSSWALIFFSKSNAFCSLFRQNKEIGATYHSNQLLKKSNKINK